MIKNSPTAREKSVVNICTYIVSLTEWDSRGSNPCPSCDRVFTSSTENGIRPLEYNIRKII